MTQTEDASYRRSNRTYKSIWDWSHFPSPDPPRKLSSALDIFSPPSSIVSHTFHIPYRAFRQTILRLYHIFIVIRQAHSEDEQVPNRQQSRCLSVRAAEFTCNIQTISILTGATCPNHPFPVHFRNLPTPRCHFGSCERLCQDQARAPKLAPGTSSRNFGMPTLLKMTLASRFITWDSELIYINLPFVSLSTISTSHRLRAPEVTSDAATLKGVVSTSSTKSKLSSAAASTRSVREEMRQTV